MDVKVAASRTLIFLLEHSDYLGPFKGVKEVELPHLIKLLKAVMDEGEDSTGKKVIGEKAHRHLSFAQGVMATHGVRVDQLKEFNRNTKQEQEQ